MWPFSLIKKLRAENKRLAALITKQMTYSLMLEDVDVGVDGGLTMGLSGSAMHLFADAFQKQFVNSGATNFLTVEFHHKDSNENYQLTMEKVNGESAVSKISRLETALETIAAIEEEGHRFSSDDALADIFNICREIPH